MTLDEQERSEDKEDYRASGKRGGRLSEILDSIARDEARARVSVSDIFQAMGDRAFGALLLIFALPNVFPTPPGTSALLGAPLVFLSAQLMLGQAPWLPKIIAHRSMTREDFGSIVMRISPWLARGERMLRPRAVFLVYPPMEYLIGFLCLFMSIILILPIPLGNILPALAICLFAFGILERDGLVVVAGFALVGLSIAVVASVLVALVKGFIFLLTSSLG